MTDKIIVLTTAGSRQEAEEIASALLERRLAACVNILGPVHSIYRWKGAVESASEHVLLIKTLSGEFIRVRDAIRELHSYELPECITIRVEDGAAAYLAWIEDSLRKE
jgi:periplasmic divalent cation tolerance protein